MSSIPPLPEDTWPGRPQPMGSPYGPPPGAPAGWVAVPPAGGGGAAFKAGLAFGGLAALLNLLQIAASAASIAANRAGIDAWTSSPDVTAYFDCVNKHHSGAGCPQPLGTPALGAVFATFYGTCLLAFFLTLVVYLFAGRAAARQTGRRGTGVGAAVIAAVVGSLLYTVFSLAEVIVTGRSGLIAGIGTIPAIDPSAFTAGLVVYTVIADGVALLATVGIAALMGLWGGALGAARAQATYAFAPPRPAGAPPPYPPGYPGITGLQPPAGAQAPATPPLPPAPEYPSYPPPPDFYANPGAPPTPPSGGESG